MKSNKQQTTPVDADSEDSYRYNLVEGTFTVDDAREILMSLIHSKINFHNLKILSSQERKGITDSSSEQRIDELNKSRKELLKLLETLDKKNKVLRIQTVIQVAVE